MAIHPACRTIVTQVLVAVRAMALKVSTLSLQPSNLGATLNPRNCLVAAAGRHSESTSLNEVWGTSVTTGFCLMNEIKLCDNRLLGMKAQQRC